MKIVILNNLYYPYNRGGAEAVVKVIIDDLKSQGHDVFLITNKPKTTAKNSNLENKDLKIYYIESNYFNLAELSLAKKLIWHFNNLFSFKNSKYIKEILKTERPDLIMTHNLMGLGFRLPVIIRNLKITHEHYLHDIQLLHPSGLIMFGNENIVNSLIAKIYQYFTRCFFSSPYKIISPSKWLLEQHLKKSFFKKSITEINNVFAKNNVEELKTISKKGNNFLFIGQIEYHKGITLLIKSFKEALKIKPEIKLSVVGNGLLLDKLINENSDQKEIEFIGRVEGYELKKIMSKNDYLIVPSLCYENAPTTIFEAHSNGLKVIAAEIGGIPEIVNSNDELFKPGDFEDLKNHILSK